MLFKRGKDGEASGHEAKKDQFVVAMMAGDLRVRTDQGIEVQIRHVLYIPEICANILNVPRLQADGYSINFGPMATQIML